MTGNLGAIDGTNTSRPSSALMNRVEVHLVSDQPAEFASRLIVRTKDRIGDLGMSGFIKRNPELFWKMPEKGSFPSPRAWDNAIDAMRSLVYSNGGSLAHSLNELRGVMAGFIGGSTAEAACDYLHQLTIGADPLARAMIENGKWDRDDEAKFKQSYSNGGFTADQMTFAYQFGTALADYAAQEIVLNPRQKEYEALHKEMTDYKQSLGGKTPGKIAEEKIAKFQEEMSKIQLEILDKSICNFILGMARLDGKDQVLALGVQQLVDKLAYQLPLWSHEAVSDERQIRKIQFEVKSNIAKCTKGLIESNKDSAVEESQLITVINALTMNNTIGVGKVSLRKKAK
jgi:hypothetical protein